MDLRGLQVRRGEGQKSIAPGAPQQALAAAAPWATSDQGVKGEEFQGVLAHLDGGSNFETSETCFSPFRSGARACRPALPGPGSSKPWPPKRSEEEMRAHGASPGICLLSTLNLVSDTNACACVRAC